MYHSCMAASVAAFQWKWRNSSCCHGNQKWSCGSMDAAGAFVCQEVSTQSVVHMWQSHVETQADIYASTKCVYMKLNREMGFKCTPSLASVLGTFCMASMVMLYHICHCSSAGRGVALLRVLELPLPKETWVCSLRWHLNTTGTLCNRCPRPLRSPPPSLY